MGTKSVLHNVDLTLSEGNRVVLVGENGTGKTTLMRIMSGDMEPDSGQVVAVPWCHRTFVPQEFDTTDHVSAAEYLAGARQSAVAALLGRINASKLLEYNDVQHLSGGQQRLLQLAVAFAQRPDFLLLDEPENHLDYFAREWLIELIRDNPGGMLLVSHDQYVTDEVANQIIELSDGEITSYPGTYEEYLEAKARQVGGGQRRWAKET